MPNESVYVFQHIECETLGTFATVLADRGVRADYIRLFAGDVLPGDWRAARMLIFLGGPMSVNDEGRYPFLIAEKALIREALAERTSILGVCLGAQLLAAAAGSRVFPGSRPEIGWEPVTLTMDGQLDPVLSPLAHLPAVFHWHGETFDLPLGAVRLAFSALTMNQAFRMGRHAYGLQFHLEIDPAMIETWIRTYPDDVKPNPAVGARRIGADTAQYVKPLQEAAHEVMQRFLDAPDHAKAAGE